MTTRVRYPDTVVYCDGVPVKALEVHCRTARNEVGTAAITFPLPLDAAVVPGAVVEVHATIGEQSAIVHQGSFRGPEQMGIAISGKQAVARSDDWWWIMAIPYREDRAWVGPVSVKTIIRGMFEEREFGQPGKPTFVVHEFKDAAGATILLGGNADVDGGQVIVPAGTSPFAWIARVCDLFGYAMSNRYGVCRVTRMYGLPNEDPATSFQEGDEGFAYEGTVDLHQIVTWWDVRGASGTDEDGVPFAYRSFPASIPSNPDVPFPTPKIVTDNLLISDALCQIVRNIKEVEYSERRRLVRWSADGQPRRRPGNVVTVTSASAGLPTATDLWLYTVELDWDVRAGLTSHFEGSFGGGEALPSGEDVCVDVSLGAGPYHVGDETNPLYAVPSPSGVTRNFDFTPAADMTSLSVECEVHSVNQFVLRGQTTATLSTWRLEQPVGTEIDEKPLPPMHEGIGAAPSWVDSSVPLAGSLVGGTAARLVLVCGALAGDEDDFEVRNVYLRHCAEGQPTLPDDPIAPVIPPPRPSVPTCLASMTATIPATSGFVNSPFSSFVVPAGTVYLKVAGTATGLVSQGYAGGGGGDAFTFPKHNLCDLDGDIQVNNWALFVPGTQDPDATEPHSAEATIRTGSGTFARVIKVHPTGLPSPVTVDNFGFQARSGAPSYTVTNACVTAHEEAP